MAVQWTKEQQQVIQLRDRNILVSAAAGSGKTAVLTERIVKMLTDENAPVDVDRLLVVTFTDAAAAEMKERVHAAIEALLEERPGDVHLQRQATLIYSAQITTIDSFCVSVLRDHFHVIGLDPGFRTAERGELKLLQQDVLAEVLEEYYAAGTKEFLEMTEKLSIGRNDHTLEELVLKVYDDSRSYPQPEKWLKECAASYELPVGKEETAPFVKKAEAFVRRHVQNMLEITRESIRISATHDGPYMYMEALQADQEMLERVAREEDFHRLYTQIYSLQWKSLSGKRDSQVSAEKRKQVQELRRQVKKTEEKIKKTYFFEPPEELFADIRSSAETVRAFTDLVQSFATAFSEKKQSRNLIDFADMEQYALRILTEEKDGKLLPSKVARDYQEQFVEVMIDEYQDSNFLQDAILTSVSRMSRGQNNMFMVGDVKQSIYRFRQSRPELFMQKYGTYTREDSGSQRIDLHRNFRSRPEILDSVNEVFARIMTKELGGICYDDEAALYPGAEFPPFPGLDVKSELLLFDLAEEDPAEPGGEAQEERQEKTSVQEEKSAQQETSVQIEARLIAARIRTLMQEMWVKDKASGEYRRVCYQDIVILLRSTKGRAEQFVSVLGEEGIPAYTSGGEGYFETYEISVLLSYLQVLDNPNQDLPLAAVLTSPFVGLSAREMAEIRIAGREMPFYEAVRHYAAGGKSPRLNAFYRQMEEFRDMLPYTPIHELLWQIMEKTGYRLYMTAMPGGKQRAANLEMLMQEASVFEQTSYKGLFHFVRYIEQLKKYEVEHGEANIFDEQSDTVRIMSIHKSKGLEFPVVFVAGLGKKFNLQDTSDSMLVHPAWGIGINAVDLERRTKAPTLLKKVIGEETLLESLGEEMRILYVAMTRAKEKLILSGQVKNAVEKWEYCGQFYAGRMDSGTEKTLPFHLLINAKNALDWLLPAAAQAGSLLKVTVWNRQMWAGNEQMRRHEEILQREQFEQWDTKKVYDPVLKKELEKQFTFCYPYKRESRFKMQFTVSELKKSTILPEDAEEIYREPDVIPLLPKFLQEENENRGAARGTAYHRLLELLDFSREYDENSLTDEISRMCREKSLSPEMVESICVQDILYFLHSDSGKRMHRAARKSLLAKEQPFVLGIDAAEIYPKTESGETILIQGIIDVYFEEEDGLVLLDYKTDHIYSGQILKEKYHTQLDYYARALEQLLQKPVKEKVIYSFTLKEEIRL